MSPTSSPYNANGKGRANEAMAYEDTLLSMYTANTDYVQSEAGAVDPGATLTSPVGHSCLDLRRGVLEQGHVPAAQEPRGSFAPGAFGFAAYANHQDGTSILGLSGVWGAPPLAYTAPDPVSVGNVYTGYPQALGGDGLNQVYGYGSHMLPPAGTNDGLGFDTIIPSLVCPTLPQGLCAVPPNHDEATSDCTGYSQATSSTPAAYNPQVAPIDPGYWAMLPTDYHGSFVQASLADTHSSALQTPFSSPAFTSSSDLSSPWPSSSSSSALPWSSPSVSTSSSLSSAPPPTSSSSLSSFSASPAVGAHDIGRASGSGEAHESASWAPLHLGKQKGRAGSSENRTSQSRRAAAVPYPPPAWSPSTSSAASSPSAASLSAPPPEPGPSSSSASSPPRGARRAAVVKRGGKRRLPDAVPSQFDKSTLTCNACVPPRQLGRSQDFHRHKTDHAGEGRYVCAGIPESELARYGIPPELALAFEGAEYAGETFVGGCWKAFTRKESYGRHLNNKNLPCVGDLCGMWHPINQERAAEEAEKRAKKDAGERK